MRSLYRSYLPIIALLSLASTGCDGGSGSVKWLVQPSDEAASSNPPHPLSNGQFLTWGWSYNSPTAGDADPYMEWISPSGEPTQTVYPKLESLTLNPTLNGPIAFASTSAEQTEPEVGLMGEDGAVTLSFAVAGAAAAYLSSDQTLVVTGEQSAFADPEDVFVKKVDLNGNELWTFHRNTLPFNRIYKAITLPDGGVLFFGPTAASFPMTDSYITRLDATGSEVWTRELSNISLLDIAIDPENITVYTTGSTIGSDIYIAAHDSDGNDIWTKTFTSENDDTWADSESGWSIAFRPVSSSDVSEILVGGSFAENIDFGLDTPLQGRYDAFLLAMTPEGEPTWQMSGSSDGSDLFRASYGPEGSILAMLYFSTGGFSSADNKVDVANKGLELRGIQDSAVMQIDR